MVVHPPIFNFVMQWIPCFIAFPAFFRKIKKIVYSLIVYKGKVLVCKKVANITKTKNDTLCQVWFSTPTPPWFLVTICCYFILRPVFVSTPVWCNLCTVSNGKYNFEDKIYYISIVAVLKTTEFPILKKQKPFFDVYLIKHTLFPEGSTKNIKF